MILDAVDTKDWDRWARHPSSILLNHQAKCCAGARNWFLASARSFDWSVTEGRRSPGTRWLSSRFKWGANRWPLFWCEVFHLPHFDCGVYAALMREIFAEHGREAFGGQIIVKSNLAATEHTSKKWTEEKGSFGWIGRGYYYHEIVIVPGDENRVRIYDPTEGVWLNPEHRGGYLSPVAVRSEAGRARQWGKYHLFPDQWCELEEEAT